MTGADIAASTDLTGNAALGGDWILEATTGQIESSLNINANYAGTLQDFDLDQDNNDTAYGTTSTDIMDGNGGNDTLYGNDSNDFIYGDDGRDSLHGGNGDDIIHGDSSFFSHFWGDAGDPDADTL